MKKFFILIALVAGMATQGSAQSYKKEGNTYVAVNSRRTTAAKADSTGIKYKDVDGKTYPLCLSRNGRAYIIRTSKNGNQYRKYLGEEISRAVCKDLGREYIEK